MGLTGLCHQVQSPMTVVAVTLIRTPRYRLLIRSSCAYTAPAAKARKGVARKYRAVTW